MYVQHLMVTIPCTLNDDLPSCQHSVHTQSLGKESTYTHIQPWACIVHVLCKCIATAAKKKGGGGGGGLSLSEEEREVIDLARVEGAMQAAITALKWEFSNTLVTRLTPGESLYMSDS